MVEGMDWVVTVLRNDSGSGWIGRWLREWIGSVTVLRNDGKYTVEDIRVEVTVCLLVGYLLA